MGKLLDRLKAIAEGSGALIEATDDRLSEVITKIENSGGGSSDFSTANVTVENMTPPNALYAPLVSDDGDARYFTLPGATNATVILHNGEAQAAVHNFMTGARVSDVEASGSARVDDDGYVIITGDCTITIS